MRVCFIINLPKQALGGAERQALGIAQILAKLGVDMHFITMSGTDSRGVRSEDGIVVHEAGVARDGRGANFVDYARFTTNLYHAMDEVDADVYYQRSASIVTGLTSLICRIKGIPFVFGSSSIWNATINLKGRIYENSPLDRIGLSSAAYKFGISRASAIVAQTEEIARIFAINFPRVRISHIPPISHPIATKSPKSSPPFVLSISRLIWYRRPELVLSVAKILPEVNFVLAGYGPMSKLIEDGCRNIYNFSYIGRVTPEEAEELMGKAAVYINTSGVEGFPNTLLECASTGTPYVSFYDPDEVICRYSLGLHVHSLTEMRSAVVRLLSDPEARRRMGQNGIEYVKNLHDPEKIGGMYEQLFKDVSTLG